MASFNMRKRIKSEGAGFVLSFQTLGSGDGRGRRERGSEMDDAVVLGIGCVATFLGRTDPAETSFLAAVLCHNGDGRRRREE